MTDSEIKLKLKRRRDDADKDEEPSVGSERGSKRRREGKEPESTSALEEKANKTTSKSTEGHKYITSLTKTKATDYGHIKWIEDLFYGFTVNRESARDVYSKCRIIVVTELQIIEWHNYKHLDWITIRKLTNLMVEERFTFNVSLRMFTRSIFIQQRVKDLQLGVESYQKKLNLTKPDTYRFDLKRKEVYTAYSNLKGFIYQNKDKQNRLMRINKLHKFSDGTLNDVRTALDDRLKDLDTLSSVRRPKPSGVKADLSFVNRSNLNKNVKRYSRKNLMACNNSDTRSAFDCNNARNAMCDARMNASVDVNDFFVFDDIVKIYLWIIDLGCSKHMTGNRALLMNFVEKFLGTVRFGNNDFTVIAGYGDVVIGSMTIKKVYYVEDGVDLLTGDRSSNLYTISLNEVASNSLACLLSKASSSQFWLWHHRLSHLNFATINNLMKNNLVQGLPKMKFEKDHLCSACEQGKIHRKHHKSKTDFSSNKPLYLLHMDLCGPMRIESINERDMC
nr:hypothetical protein [Tanacetum cinerariifolium]